MSNTVQTIEFTKEKLQLFKHDYKKAKEKELSEFTFEGHGFLLDYAKYAIEYLDSQMSKNN